MGTFEEYLIIGISGKAGSGKTTMANYIVNKFKTNPQVSVQEYALSTPLKRIGSALGFSTYELYGSQESKLKINPFWKISGRDFMQMFGTMCREVLPDVIPTMDSLFIQVAEKTLIACKKKYIEEKHESALKRGVFIISDIRYPDEAALVRKYRGVIINTELYDSNTKTNMYKHESEQQKIKSNYNIINFKDIQYYLDINAVLNRAMSLNDLEKTQPFPPESEKNEQLFKIYIFCFSISIVIICLVLYS
jgi:hypothetical protein